MEDERVASAGSSPKTTLSRNEVRHLVSLGHMLVLHRRKVYRLNNWLGRHPGGHLAILHFVGRDAANEIEAYHCKDTIERVMRHYIIARVEEKDFSDEVGWKPLTPPVQVGKEGAFGSIDDYAGEKGTTRSWKQDLQVYRAGDVLKDQHKLLDEQELEPPSPPASINPADQYRMSKAWEVLHQKLEDEGLYKARPLWHYRVEFIRYFGLFLGFLWVFMHANRTWHYYLAATLLGACWHQVTFVVHDAGHTEVTGNYHGDRIIGSLVASWFGGLSCAWWCDNHNIHHLVTNHVEHDPDIQHVPFFAISTKFFNNLYSTYKRRPLLFDAASRFFVSLQHKLYYVVMSLARFNLFAESYMYLLFRAPSGFYRNLEMTGIVFFWCWFGKGVLGSIPDFGTRIGFLVLCFVVTSPLHVQIVLSHFAQSTEDLGLYESFPARQLRTTMDVTCPEYMEWIHGGLNMQVTHHLFPRLPRHNLRPASKFIKEFAKEQGLDYHTYYFIQGNQRVLSVLKDVANQVNVLGKVASAQARGEFHHH